MITSRNIQWAIVVVPDAQYDKEVRQAMYTKSTPRATLRNAPEDSRKFVVIQNLEEVNPMRR